MQDSISPLRSRILRCPVARSIDSPTRAFNLGSDARIVGLPLDANPYGSGRAAMLARNGWVDGWHDVDRFWKTEVRRKR